jgi:Holliday junction resolvasome RuvABC endonuclease subunit
MTAPVVLGIDLSLRGTGLVALPADWSLDWSRVAFETIGHPLRRDASEADRIGRLVRLSAEVVRFAGEHGATHAVLEQYAFGQHGAQARAIAELGGVVKVLLAERSGLEVATVPASAARKLLLGRVPRAGAKQVVADVLREMGAPFRTVDEADGFAVANWQIAELGFAAVTLQRGAA